MVRLLKESMLLDWQNAIMSEIKTELKKNHIYSDLYDEYGFRKNDSFVLKIDINNGDWKHEHRLADIIVSNVADRYDNIEIVKVSENVTDDDGSDTYSATHTYNVIRFPDEDITLQEPVPLDITFSKVEKLNRKRNNFRNNVKESIYTDNGFSSRSDYLKSLADDFGVPFSTVQDLASVLGPEEDFDALVTELEDMADDYTGEDNTTFLKELDYALKHYNYVVYDNESDEFDWWIGHFDDYKSAAENICIDICRYNMDVVLCDTRKRLRTFYNANKLNVNVLDTGKADMNYYDFSYFSEDPEHFMDYSVVGEDVSVENIRDILDMCKVKTETF